MVDEEGQNWELLLPSVVFAIWEMPQASTGFTPFELFFSQQPRGLLDAEPQSLGGATLSPFSSLVEYVKEMQEQIDQVMPIIRER